MSEMHFDSQMYIHKNIAYQYPSKLYVSPQGNGWLKNENNNGMTVNRKLQEVNVESKQNVHVQGIIQLWLLDFLHWNDVSEGGAACHLLGCREG